MWFFSEFCNRYGRKIYQGNDARFVSDEPTEIRNLITFARIYIFERIVAYYNKYMKDDARLEPILQQINRVHFVEESRHIAMGEAVIKEFVGQVSDKYGVERLDNVGEYLKAYTQHCVNSFYNPAVYRDFGADNPYEMRRELMAHPARKEFDAMLMDQGTRYLARLGLEMFSQAAAPAAEHEGRIGRLTEWIQKTCSPKVDIDPDTDLIENRIVTSLQMVELVLLVEELRGREIPQEERNLDNFRSLRTIATHYFSD
jgi:acyl carrier protein